jgi:hypothetical protein
VAEKVHMVEKIVGSPEVGFGQHSGELDVVTSFISLLECCFKAGMN